MIITKSISRFARNTLDCLNYVRELKELGIGVIFEKENINTLDSKGEVLITILASLAQDESRSIFGRVSTKDVEICKKASNENGCNDYLKACTIISEIHLLYMGIFSISQQVISCFLNWLIQVIATDVVLTSQIILNIIK